jgi:isopenicillin N synthase-like dioxygenase
MLMASAFKHLPVINVSGLYSDSEADRRAVAQQMGEAAKDSGFFYVTGHPVSRELRANLIEATKSFFSWPQEQKMKWYIGLSENHSGYVPPGEETFYGQKPDRKEAFDLPLDVPADDPQVLAGNTPMLGPVNWPDHAAFRENAKNYYDEISEFARKLFAGFALALDMPETWFEPQLKTPASQLRLIHYPFNPDAPADEPGIGAHTDYECFTILLPTAPGLEVMNGAREWIDAPPVDDAFVINIGDMLEAWSNGIFAATSHRVRKVQEERYSFPYFASCDYHTVVAPLPQFVTPERPAKHTALVAGDHLLAQTAQTFTYLKKKIEAGTFILPKSSLSLSSFGQEARVRKAV